MACQGDVESALKIAMPSSAAPDRQSIYCLYGLLAVDIFSAGPSL